MKTKTTLIAVAILMIAQMTSATVWRVNATPNSSADYTTIQAAHDNAATLSDDTLYLEGSTFPVGGLTISKKLTIIGNGYFLAENPETQHNISPSIFSSIVSCVVGSEGSKFTGCTFNSPVYIYTNNWP